jgi:hypothetical protein
MSSVSSGFLWDLGGAAEETALFLPVSHVLAYRERLLASLDEARPYRHMFPLGALEGRD